MKIKVCTWTNCSKKFSKYIIKRLKADIEKFNLKNIEIEESHCMWMCSIWPNIKIDSDIINKANPIKASEAMFKRLKK